MAEGGSSKYGRLFTERDVRELLRHSIPHSADPDRAFVNAEYNGWRPTFPADEPLFLLRGQDEAAPDAIAPTESGPGESVDYWWSARAAGAGQEHLDAIETAADRMRRWQAANPDRVKIPD